MYLVKCVIYTIVHELDGSKPYGLITH